ELGRIFPTNDPDAAAGTILAAQVDGSPVAEGDEVLEGSRVDLTVATGLVTINDLTDMPYEFAKNSFEQLGLKVEQIVDDACHAGDPIMVETQNPAAGDVGIHTTVTRRVCGVPDVQSGDSSAAGDDPAADDQG